MASDSIRHLGATGRSVVLGTAAYGTGFDTDPLLDHFVERGGRLVDVAVHYSGGAAERAVGDWLRRSGARDSVVLLAKGCHPPRVSPDQVGPEVERSREQLGVEQLDCFVLHRDDTSLDVSEWGDALVAQIEAGTVSTVGVSNWTTPRTRALAAYLRDRGSDRLVLLSNHRSLVPLVQEPWPGAVEFDSEADALPAEGIVLQSWSSLAGGYFNGSETLYEHVRRGWHSPANEARRERASALAADLGVETGTVALAWLLAHPGLLAAIGPQTIEQLDEGLSAEQLELSPEQMSWLRDGPVD
jgi:aryl-alcohol dehydrogenase-like predicted oxidoreductase